MFSSAELAWQGNVTEAKAVQEALRGRVELEDRIGRVRTVAGVDVAVDRTAGRVRAAVASFDLPDLELGESSVAVRGLTFPYIPGYLSFREIPVILDALAAIRTSPDLVICDGHGFAHPRRFGLASHLGVTIDTPTIGVGKSRLVGVYDRVPARRGEWVALRAKTDEVCETIGAVLCTRSGVKPVFVSVGHRISLPRAIEWVLRCTRKFRLPETTRAADRLAAWR